MKRSTVIFIFLFVIIFQTMTILHGQNSSSGTIKSANQII